MTAPTPRGARVFYVGLNGDRWMLTRDPSTKQLFVLHSPADDEAGVELDLGSFLALFHGRERDGLLQMIGTLLPGEEPSSQGEPGFGAPLKFMSA